MVGALTLGTRTTLDPLHKINMGTCSGERRRVLVGLVFSEALYGSPHALSSLVLRCRSLMLDNSWVAAGGVATDVSADVCCVFDATEGVHVACVEGPTTMEE